MKVGIIAAKTGNGHISVMNALKEEFERQGEKDIYCFPSFYEDMMVSNKILSDFYNFLMVNSVALCEKYCEFTYMTRPDLSQDFYEGVKEYIYLFLIEHKFDILISVSHTINAAIIRVIREHSELSNIKFCVVVTDPYEPIAVGFAVEGADKYYCATDVVKNILTRANIATQKIVESGYPISYRFQLICENSICEELGFDKQKPIILLNAGSQGIYHYFDMLKKLVEISCELQIIVICGKNLTLYNQCQKIVKKRRCEDNIKVLGFVDNIEMYMNICDLVITKAGANAIYEALMEKKPILIDAIDGFLFQERGIQKLLEKHDFGLILENVDKIESNIKRILDNKKYYINNIIKMDLHNGSYKIINDIKNL